MSFKRGELVIYNNELYKVYGEANLNGTIRIRSAKYNGIYRRVFIGHLTKATPLLRELL